MKPKHVAIVGATGSIGRQTLDVARRFPDELAVVGLAAGRRAAPVIETLASSPWLRRTVRRIVGRRDAAEQVNDALRRR